MEAFLSSASFLMPLVVLLAFGYFAVRFHYFKLDNIAYLLKFFMYFVVPATTFLFTARMPTHVVFESWPFALSFAIVVVIMSTVSYILSRYFGLSHKNATAFASCASMPNIGFVGLPILLSLPNGHNLVHYWLVVMLVTLAFISFVFVPMLRLDTKHISVVNIGRVFAESVKVPLIIATILGIVVAVSGISLPDFAIQSLSLISNGIVGFGLVCLGMTVTFQFLFEKSYLVWLLIVAKGIVMPLLAYLIATNLFSFDKQQLLVSVVLACCPVAGIGVILAHQRSDIGYEAGQAMVGTIVLCFVSIALCHILL